MTERAAPSAIDLGRARYVSLATFRKNGREVRTPVWIAPGERGLVVYTNRRSGKVKRIRANGRARLAICDARGRVRSALREATAQVLDEPAERDRALAAIVRKYGWQMRLALLASRLSGRFEDRTALRLEVSSDP